jgi:hypothetical protein
MKTARAVVATTARPGRDARAEWAETGEILRTVRDREGAVQATLPEPRRPDLGVAETEFKPRSPIGIATKGRATALFRRTS